MCLHKGCRWSCCGLSLLYVDDMLLAGAYLEDIQEVKKNLREAFDMKDLGSAKRILGMTIIRDRGSKRIGSG